MSESVLKQVAELERQPLAALRERWRELYGTEPPAYGRSLFVRRLAYRIQELAFGGLCDAAQEKLEEAMSDVAAQSAVRKRRKNNGKPISGTQLVRDWNGVRYEVTVLEKGFEFQGKRYRSLSAIAREITGTQWSGPAFFGLREAASASRSHP